MRKKKLSKKRLKLLWLAKIDREFNKAWNNQDAEKAADWMLKGVKNLPKTLDQSRWIYPYISRQQPDPNVELKETRFQLTNFLSHNNTREQLKNAYDADETIHWQASLADVSMRDSNIYLLLNHIIPVIKGTTVDFNPSDEPFYEYHLWLNVKDIFSIQNDSQKLAIGDTLIGTSLIKKYVNKKKEVKYGLGATKLEFAGIFKANNDEFLKTNSRHISFDCEFLPNYQREYVIVDLKRCQNYDIRSKRYKDLKSFNQSRENLILGTYYDHERQRYFEMLNDPEVKQERLDWLKKRTVETFKTQFEVNNLGHSSPLLQKQTDWFSQMRLHNKNVD